MLLRDFVNLKMVSADKEASAEGYPLKMENCKKYKKMRGLKMYGNSLQDGIPTPDAPVEVQTVGEKSVNLFDVNTIEVLKAAYAKDITITDNGVYYVVNSDTGHGNVTVKIALASDYAGKTLTLNTPNYYNSTSTQLLLFDGSTVSKVGSPYTSNNNGLYYTTLTINESDCADGIYLCIRLYYNEKTLGDIIEYSNIMMTEGSTATPYEPYGKYKIPVVQRGINLFCLAKTDAKEQTINGITFTPLDDERVHIKGKVIDISKNVVVKFLAKSKGNMPIKRGIYKAKPNKFTFSGLTLMFGINNNSVGKNVNSMNSSTAIEFDNAYIGNLYLGISEDGLTREWDDIIELQLMKGTEDLPYEPYVEPVTTNIFLDEPLRKLGNYADYIEFKENKVIRNTKECVFKGGEIDNVYTGYTNLGYNLYRTKANFLNNAYVENLDSWLSVYPEKSTHFTANAFRASTAVKINQWTIKTDYALNFTLAPQTYVSDGVNATAKDINNWLASQYENGTPITFYYILKEPTQEPISLNLPKLTAKTTIIEVDTSLTPSNAYGKFIKNRR